MKLRKLFLLNLSLAALLPSMAQNEEKQPLFKVETHGFVGVTFLYDTRQNASARHNHILLYPKPAEPDANGNDINAQGSFDFDASHSRIGFFVSGPDVWGAKSSAVLEGDFLGGSGGRDVNIRIRLAYVKLQWSKNFLLLGEAFHPLFVTEIFPNTQSLSAGTPYHPLNRSVMAHFAHNLSANWQASGYLIGQNDFKSSGIDGVSELSMLPEFTLRIRYTNSKGTFAVLQGGWLHLKPSLVDDNGLKSNKMISSGYFSGSFRQHLKQVTAKAGFVYGGNMTAHTMIGGVGKLMLENNDYEYVSLQTVSYWTDWQYTKDKWALALFAGYSANLGAPKKVEIVSKYSRGAAVGSMYQLTPRITFTPASKIWFGIEYQFNQAYHGSQTDAYGKPFDLAGYHNHRISLNTRYQF